MSRSRASALTLVAATALMNACRGDPTVAPVFEIAHSVGASGCLAPPAGMVSWWPGAADGTDIVGPNHGLLQGGITAGAAAFVGGGFALDGASGFIDAGNDPSLDLTQALSLVAWINVDHFNTLEPTQNVIGKGNFGGNGDESYALVVNQDRTAAIQLNHGRYPGRIDLNRLEISTGGTGRMNAGQWHLIAGTFDITSGTVKMFLDGVVKGFLPGWSDVQVMGGLWGTSQPVLLGKTNRAGSPYPTSTYAGLIDEPQIYNRALTDAEVLAIYEAGPAGLCSAPVEGPPTARITPVAPWDEGAVVQFDGTTSTTDPAGGSLTYHWDFGDGSTASGPTPTHVYGDDGAYAVRLTVTTTPGGLQDIATTSITGNNLPPILGTIAAPIEPKALSSTISATIPFVDPGSLDTHSAEVDWSADGTPVVRSATVSGGVASGSHTYTTPGVYTIKMTVTDDDGGAASSWFRYVVVYDPEAGFVTGGGNFDSPAGAFVANSALTGRAQFAFVSRYEKGADVPTGNTQFKFQTAGLDFSSTSYEWLVVAGAKAQYKGAGRINGAGDFGFLLSAVDGALPGGLGTDRIRIKIWNRADGAVVYDNHVGADDIADPVTAITGGSIIIHK